MNKTQLQMAFIALDADIQQVGDIHLQQRLTYGMIDIMNALAKTELDEYFNGYKEKETDQED